MQNKKEINVQIGEQVRCAREHCKYTQEKLAEAVGVTPQYISDLERGIVGISIPTLKKVCLALNVSSDQILFGTSNVRTISFISEKCKDMPEKQFDILCDIIDKYIEAIKSN